LETSSLQAGLFEHVSSTVLVMLVIDARCVMNLAATLM
jgi:hypothetical protein